MSLALALASFFIKQRQKATQNSCSSCSVPVNIRTQMNTGKNAVIKVQTMELPLLQAVCGGRCPQRACAPGGRQLQAAVWCFPQPPFLTPVSEPFREKTLEELNLLTAGKSHGMDIMSLKPMREPLETSRRMGCSMPLSESGRSDKLCILATWIPLSSIPGVREVGIHVLWKNAMMGGRMLDTIDDLPDDEVAGCYWI